MKFGDDMQDIALNNGIQPDDLVMVLRQGKPDRYMVMKASHLILAIARTNGNFTRVDQLPQPTQDIFNEKSIYLVDNTLNVVVSDKGLYKWEAITTDLTDLNSQISAILSDMTTHQNSINTLSSELSGKAAAQHSHSNATTLISGYMSSIDKYNLNHVVSVMPSFERLIRKDTLLFGGSYDQENTQLDFRGTELEPWGLENLSLIKLVLVRNDGEGDIIVASSVIDPFDFESTPELQLSTIDILDYISEPAFIKATIEELRNEPKVNIYCSNYDYLWHYKVLFYASQPY